MKDQTLAIHAGFKSDPTTKSVSVPIYQTIAFEFDNAQHGADLFNLAAHLFKVAHRLQRWVVFYIQHDSHLLLMPYNCNGQLVICRIHHIVTFNGAAA